MIELLMDNRNGNVWDISEMSTDIAWKTERIGKPSSLEFTMIKNKIAKVDNFEYNNGDIVRFKYDKQDIFYGYIFDVSGGKGEAIKIKAYDQTRYLMNEDTYVFSNTTASQILRRIASDFNLIVGRVDNTGYRIPTMVEDGQTLFDIITKALDLTLINTNQNFVLFDDFGRLSIRNIEDMLVDVLVGDESLLYDFDYKRSIDDETYNRIKLYRDNEETGRRDVFMAQDSSNISRWGALQLYESVDDNMNNAQIRELLDQLMALRNRETQTLKLRAIGEPRIRAGCYIPVEIDELGINQPFLIDSCTQKFSPERTMELEVKVI